MTKSIKQFKQFEEALKNFNPLMYLPFSKKWIKHHEENMNGLSYLSYCGIEITDEVLNEIEKIRETTPRTFKESCYYYVTNLPS